MNLKIKFVPYEKFKKSSIKSFLKDLEANMIILVDAKLTADEESNLIKETMKRVSSNFSGIEFSSLDITAQNGQTRSLERVRNRVAELITGKKRGLTIVGPAKIVRKIERNPEELLLYM